MITVISPDYFKTIPWKNGLGSTTELAISSGGKLDDFAWRLSIATVDNDGVFSDFSGYQRDLVLIAGKGITLEHDGKSTDNLTKLLDVAHFDGGSKTVGTLSHGSIKDFNIMTKQGHYSAKVNTYTNKQVVTMPAKSELVFVYSLSSYCQVSQASLTTSVPTGSLARLDNDEHLSKHDISISGENMIVIELTKVT